jgi:hypothetical protein
MKITKDKMEEIFRRVGVLPERWEKHGDLDIYVADGFVSPQNFWKFQWKFGNFLNDGEFPLGAYVTAWFIGKDEEIVQACPFACEPFHDTGLSIEAKKLARINTAMKGAKDYLGKVSLNG